MRRCAGRIAPWLAAAGMVLVSLGFAGAVWLLRGSLPDEPAELDLPGLDEPVDIRYDAARRPFVTAASLEAALFAQGWLHGRERLWQMELLRRAGRGRLAEVLGGGLLATDRQLWRAGVPQLGAELNRNTEDFVARLVQRYVAGINTALVRYRVMPPEFLAAGFEPAPWTPNDVYAVGALMAFQSANNYENELLRMALASEMSQQRFSWFLPAESKLPDFPYVLGDAAGAEAALASLAALDPLNSALPSAALGSNGWVVAPERSASGNALFAFDSHDALGLPNLFYEVHLFFAPGGQIRGWSVPGLPGVINGYNDRIAWGLTNIGDTQDLFVETRHPDDPLQFKAGDGWYRATVEHVRIPVRGRAVPVSLEIVHTRHGPLIHDDPPLALAWTGHQVGSAGLGAFLRLNLAGSWAAFSAALDSLPAPTTNVTYADVDGNIGFRTAGNLPLRSAGVGLVPLDGAGAGAGWRGMLPVGELPRSLNPPTGYLAAANARVVPGEQPLVSADNAPGYRMRRLRAALSGQGKLTLDDMQRLQMDWRNEQAALLLPALLPALERAELGGQDQQALELLARWSADPRNDPDLAAPLIYEHFYVALAREVFAEALPPPLFERLLGNNYVLNHALDRVILDPGASPWWESRRGAKVVRAFRSAVEAAARRQPGPPRSWRWGDVQSVTLPHELAGEIPVLGPSLSRGPFSWGGGPATVGRARYRYDRPFQVRAGATVRVVAEMGSPVLGRAIMPGGQSGHPWSANYADQTERWLAGELDPLPVLPNTVPGAVTRLR